MRCRQARILLALGGDLSVETHPGRWETARAFCTPPLGDMDFDCVSPYKSRWRRRFFRKSHACQRFAGQIEQPGLLIALAPLPGPDVKPQISMNESPRSCESCCLEFTSCASMLHSAHPLLLGMVLDLVGSCPKHVRLAAIAYERSEV